MNRPPLADPIRSVPFKITLALLRLLRILAAVDFLALMLTGGYKIPFTPLRSLYPCTSLFLILLTTLFIHWAGGDMTPGKKDWLGTDGRILIIIWMVFLGNFRWRGSGDVVAASLQPFALLEHGHLYLDEYFTIPIDGDVSGVYRRGGHILSKYSSAAGLCLVPFDLIPGLAGVVPTDLFLHQTQKIGASFMVLLSVFFLLKTLFLFLPRREAWFLALAYSFGTSALSLTSQAIWQHGPGQLALSLGLWAVLKGVEAGEKEGKNSPAQYFAIGGFAFAMAAWCRYTDILFFPAPLAYMVFKKRRGLIPFLLGAVLPFAALAADNTFHSGIPWQTGYPGRETEFTRHWWRGWRGFFLAPRGGFFYIPLFWFYAFYGFYRKWRSNNDAFLFRALIDFSLRAYYSYFKVHSMVWRILLRPPLFGGHGPDPCFCLRSGGVAVEMRGWGEFFCLNVVFSFLIHWMGAYLTWKWENEPLWSPFHHPVLYLLIGGESLDAGTRILLTSSTALVLGLAGWFALRWARSFRIQTA